MSKPQTEIDLMTHLSVMLQKHEVHNEKLVIELAIFVLQREKSALKQSHRNHTDSLNKVFDKHEKGHQS